MEFRLHAEPDVKASEMRFRGMARRARNLYPVANKLRERFYESERRLFESRGATSGRVWVARKASTLRRYRYPIRHSKGGPQTYATAAGQGVGSYTGLLEHSLTRPHQPGVRDEVLFTAGGISLNLGIKPNGPIAHGRLFDRGAGSRPARIAIFWDQKAIDDGGQDVQDYLDRGDD